MNEGKFNSRSEGFFAYNLAQMQYFLDSGLCPIAVGKGEFGDFYLVFPRDEATEEVFQNWLAYIRRIKAKTTNRGVMSDASANRNR